MRLLQFRLIHLISLTILVAVAVNVFLFSWRLFALLAIALIPAYAINRLLSSRLQRETSYWRGFLQTVFIGAILLSFYVLSIGPVTKSIFDFELYENEGLMQTVEAVYEPLRLLDDSDNAFTPLWTRYRESWYPETPDSDAQALPSSYYMK